MAVVNNDDPLGAFAAELSLEQGRPMRAQDRSAPPVAGAAAQAAGAMDTVLVDDEDALNAYLPEQPLQNTRVGGDTERISGDADDAPGFRPTRMSLPPTSNVNVGRTGFESNLNLGRTRSDRPPRGPCRLSILGRPLHCCLD